MAEQTEENANMITLVDEEGNEHDFAIVDVLLVDEKQYAILVPVAYDEETGEDDDLQLGEDAYIFRVDAVEGEETLIEVEEEDEWERVAAEWESRMQEVDGEGEIL